MAIWFKERAGQMDRITVIYRKYQNFIEKILFPLILILYPLLNVRQGIDVSDTTYSLSNFQYFPSMDGTWMVATYLANVVGNLMMHLPFGETLTGMYCYTSLIQSATAAGVYAVLRKKVPALLVFIGEWIALGLCWCPSTVLYNYLTYLLMAAGMLLLYNGIVEEKKVYYIAAGICLGMNVAVRMPNVVQMAFIIALWYGAVIDKRTFKQTVRDTLWCILGYAAGFAIPFAAICVRYGAGAYPAMVQTMFAMTEKAEDYKPAAMITGMFGGYIRGFYWMGFAAICAAGGYILFAVQRRLFAQKHSVQVLCKGVYVAVLAVLLRFYWGRGMFSFRYYNDGSIFYPAVLVLLSAVIGAVYCLSAKNTGKEQKIMAVLVLVQIFVTPLGGNNGLYPIINNLFIVVPFMLWIAHGRLAYGRKNKRVGAFVWGAPFVMLVLLAAVQSTGFHMNFAFRDGIYGEARDAAVQMPAKAAGVHTSQDNAAWLEELAEYTEDAGLTGQPALLYGNIPGLGYLLDMPSALSTFWADLDSYRMVEFERDMEQITTPPVIIVASPIAAYLAEDADGMNWFGVDQEAFHADEKLQIIAEYMQGHSYREAFGNGRYVLYVTEQ